MEKKYPLLVLLSFTDKIVQTIEILHPLFIKKSLPVLLLGRNADGRNIKG